VTIGLAFDTTISEIVITGDFNLDMQKHTSASKINSIASQYNFTQVIQQPTHYTVSSNSLIYLFLVSMNCRVSVSGVADPFLDQVCGYHCPTFCILDSSKPSSQNFKRKVWQYYKGEYVGLRREISSFEWDTIHNDDIDIYTQQLTDTINLIAAKYIPNKIVTIR
jgi:hypothetical protein